MKIKGMKILALFAFLVVQSVSAMDFHDFCFRNLSRFIQTDALLYVQNQALDKCGANHDCRRGVYYWIADVLNSPGSSEMICVMSLLESDNYRLYACRFAATNKDMCLSGIDKVKEVIKEIPEPAY